MKRNSLALKWSVILRTVFCEVADRVAIIQINRPAKRNALTAEMVERIRFLMLEADADSEIDVVILTGSDPAFCAGLDLTQLGSTGENLRTSDPARELGPFPMIGKPIIAAVNGAAITGGFEIAMACDMVVASERARFGDTHARIGLLPDWGISGYLPHAIGARKAMELLLTSNFIDAREALAVGMVNCVVPHDQLMAAATKIASDIVSNDQAVVRKLLSMQRQIARTTLGEGLQIEQHEAEAWQGRGFDTSMVASRTDSVKTRNRSRGAV